MGQRYAIATEDLAAGYEAMKSAMPMTPLKVRSGQWVRWRVTMTLDWRTWPERSSAPPRSLA